VAVERRLHHRVGVLLADWPARDQFHLTTRFAQLRSELLERFRAAAGQCDLHAAGHQGARDRTPQRPGSAGDECGATRDVEQPRHRELGRLHGHLIRLRVLQAYDLHQLVSPDSIWYFPDGSSIATRRTMQPSPFSHRHGKAANVQRLPVTASICPPTFSNPTMPFPSRCR
jgi:hypothetical protein